MIVRLHPVPRGRQQRLRRPGLAALDDRGGLREGLAVRPAE
ncbi:hypothetical protein [Nocardioides convexus]|nr:hypothetical protein [Nocardioides convexus]